jgi:hypothetical protein
VQSNSAVLARSTCREHCGATRVPSKTKSGETSENYCLRSSSFAERNSRSIAVLLYISLLSLSEKELVETIRHNGPNRIVVQYS